MTLCPTCLGKHFVYSPGGYAPKLHCPTCGKGPAPKGATMTLAERPEDVKAAQDIVREYAFDLIQPFVNAGTETTPEVDRLTGAMFALINVAWEIETMRAAMADT